MFRSLNGQLKVKDTIDKFFFSCLRQPFVALMAYVFECVSNMLKVWLEQFSLSSNSQFVYYVIVEHALHWSGDDIYLYILVSSIPSHARSSCRPTMIMDLQVLGFPKDCKKIVTTASVFWLFVFESIILWS